MTHPNTGQEQFAENAKKSDQGVTAEDREAAQRLADWLPETTKGAVRVVATDDAFFPIQAFARHRLSSTAALEAEVERWHDAYCIAHDQAMSNGEAYQDAAAQIASLKQRLESAARLVEKGQNIVAVELRQLLESCCLIKDGEPIRETLEDGPSEIVIAMEGYLDAARAFLQEQEKQNG